LSTRRPLTTLLVTHTVEEAVGLANRLLLLSVSPARILADVPIARPRAPHMAAELAALRAEIARRLNEALLSGESLTVVLTIGAGPSARPRRSGGALAIPRHRRGQGSRRPALSMRGERRAQNDHSFARRPM
jgi:hypothetical protein